MKVRDTDGPILITCFDELKNMVPSTSPVSIPTVNNVNNAEPVAGPSGPEPANAVRLNIGTKDEPVVGTSGHVVSNASTSSNVESDASASSSTN